MVMSWFSWLVLAPALEETVFRAGLHERLMARRADTAGAAWRTTLWVALAFGLAHAVLRSPLLGLLTVPVAVAIGWLFERTRRVRDCIAAHALCNAVWLLVLADSPVGRWLA